MADTTTLIPASRFGRLLRQARVGRGRSLADLETDADGRFTAGRLEQIEFGEVDVDDAELEALAALYGLEVTTLAPSRSELVIDLDAGTVTAGDRTAVADNPLDADEVLTHYLSLVYTLRGIEPGTAIPLRDLDVDVLATALKRTPAEIERELHRRMHEAGPVLAARSSNLRRRLVVPAAGVLVAATAIGALLFVRAGDDPEPTPSPPAAGSTEASIPAPVESVDEEVLFTPVPVEPGETSVEVPPLVIERDDPSDPPGPPQVVEALDPAGASGD